MFPCIRWNTRAYVLWIQMCFILLYKNALIVCLSHSAAAGAIKLFCFIHMTLTDWFRHVSTKHMSSKFRNLLLALKTKYYCLSEKALQPSVFALSCCTVSCWFSHCDKLRRKLKSFRSNWIGWRYTELFDSKLSSSVPVNESNFIF